MRLRRTEFRLVISGRLGVDSFWRPVMGYATPRRIIGVHQELGAYSFTHIPTGMGLPCLYARTLLGATPVVAALENLAWLDVPQSQRPGDVPNGLHERRAEFIAAVRGADTSGLALGPLATLLDYAS